MLSKMRRHVEPVVGNTQHLLMRLERTQGEAVTAAEPVSMALQCRFDTLAALDDFRVGTLQPALDKFNRDMPPQACMIFETVMEEMEF